MHCALKESRLLKFMRRQIQLWQHNESFVRTIMFVGRLHPRLFKTSSLKKTKDFILNQQKVAFGRLKNVALLKILKLSDYQSLNTIRKVIGSVLRH